MSKPLDELWAWAKTQLGDKAAMLVALAAFALFGMSWARGETRGAAREEVAPLRAEVDLYREELRANRVETREARADLRDWYLSQKLGRSSARLEAPLPPLDGGVP